MNSAQVLERALVSLSLEEKKKAVGAAPGPAAGGAFVNVDGVND